MTDLIAEQEAMLERLLQKHGFRKDSLPMNIGKHVKQLARELLLAVQERDAATCQFYIDNHPGQTSGWRLCASAIQTDIRAQTYADLFLKEE